MPSCGKLCYTDAMKRLILCLLAACILLCGCAPKAQPPVEFVPGEVVEKPNPTPQATPAPTLPPDPLEPAPGVYTIGWFTDPQHYAAKFPDTYYACTRFLADNADRLGMEYLVTTGDLVNDPEDEAQWQIARKAMDMLKDVPHGVLAGNHDQMDEEVWENNTLYMKYFGQEMADKPYYGGGWQNNRGHYDLIEMGDTSYIFVYLSFKPDQASIDWANQTLAAHPDRVGVLCLHEYFNTDNTLTEDGVILKEQIVAKNPNVYMVLCGHRYSVYDEVAEFDDDGDGTPDRQVLQMIMNYQAAGPEGGDGYIRFMQMDESAGKIYMYSYSPFKDDHVYFDDPLHQQETYAVDPAREQFTADIPWL